MVKYLQTIGHGEQIILHFVFIQVIVQVVFVVVKVVFKVIFFKVMLAVFDVSEAPVVGL